MDKLHKMILFHPENLVHSVKDRLLGGRYTQPILVSG
jgi:hypothetical protein